MEITGRLTADAVVRVVGHSGKSDNLFRIYADS